MTREQKIDYIARLFMYGAKVGYDSDVVEVEYFIRSVAADMKIEVEGISTSPYVDGDTGEMSGTEEDVIGQLRAKLLVLNP